MVSLPEIDLTQIPDEQAKKAMVALLNVVQQMLADAP